MTTEPLNVESLVAELPDPADEHFDGLPADTVMGHIHLKVADVAPTVTFYRDVLGFGLMAQLGPSAAFFSAGGYHHHIGTNTWESAGAPPPPPGTAALRQATIVLPDSAERERVITWLTEAGRPPREAAAGPICRDPSGNALLLSLP
jgi:catechol 2,3-dioxygenase